MLSIDQYIAWLKRHPSSLVYGSGFAFPGLKEPVDDQWYTLLLNAALSTEARTPYKGFSVGETLELLEAIRRELEA